MGILGKSLARAIKRKGYHSVEAYAGDERFSKSTLSRILRGTVDARISKLYKMSQTLGVSIDKLLRDPTRKSPKK